MFKNSLIGVADAKPKILNLVKKTAESQFKIGEILIELKDKVESYKTEGWNQKGSDYKVAKFEFDEFLISELPFGKVVANKLMQIASDNGIKTYLNDIPFAYNTMYDLVGMSDDQWKFYFKNGLNGTTTAAQIAAMKSKWLEETQPKVDVETAKQVPDESVEKVPNKIKVTKPVLDAFKNKKLFFSEVTLNLFFTKTEIEKKQMFKLKEKVDELVKDFLKSEDIEAQYELGFEVVGQQNYPTLKDSQPSVPPTPKQVEGTDKKAA